MCTVQRFNPRSIDATQAHSKSIYSSDFQPTSTNTEPDADVPGYVLGYIVGRREEKFLTANALQVGKIVDERVRVRYLTNLRRD